MVYVYHSLVGYSVSDVDKHLIASDCPIVETQPL